MTAAVQSPDTTSPRLDVEATDEVGWELELRRIYACPHLRKNVGPYGENEDELLIRPIRVAEPMQPLRRLEGQRGRARDVLAMVAQAEAFFDEHGFGVIGEADRARVRLIEGVRPYVIDKARARRGRGVDVQDLYQAGLDGVMRAMEDWDPAIAQFLTYADDWINQRMGRLEMNEGTTTKLGTRLPCQPHTAVNKVRRWLPILQDQLGREPTDEELAQVIAGKGKKPNPAAARQARELIARQLVSIHATRAGDDGDVTFAEVIADPNWVDPAEKMVESEEASRVWNVWGQLDPIEQQVLRLKIGLTPETLNKRAGLTEAEICDQLGLTRTQLKNAFARGKAKLRAELADVSL